MWTLAEASVECGVMSGATATSADGACRAEQCECAWGWDARGLDACTSEDGSSSGIFPTVVNHRACDEVARRRM